MNLQFITPSKTPNSPTLTEKMQQKPELGSYATQVTARGYISLNRLDAQFSNLYIRLLYLGSTSSRTSHTTTTTAPIRGAVVVVVGFGLVLAGRGPNYQLRKMRTLQERRPY